MKLTRWILLGCAGAALAAVVWTRPAAPAAASPRPAGRLLEDDRLTPPPPGASAQDKQAYARTLDAIERGQDPLLGTSTPDTLKTEAFQKRLAERKAAATERKAEQARLAAERSRMHREKREQAERKRLETVGPKPPSSPDPRDAHLYGRPTFKSGVTPEAAPRTP